MFEKLEQETCKKFADRYRDKGIGWVDLYKISTCEKCGKKFVERRDHRRLKRATMEYMGIEPITEAEIPPDYCECNPNHVPETIEEFKVKNNIQSEPNSIEDPKPEPESEPENEDYDYDQEQRKKAFELLTESFSLLAKAACYWRPDSMIKLYTDFLAVVDELDETIE